FDRAVERTPQFSRGFFVNVLPRDDAAAPAQICNLAAAGLERAAHQRLHQRGRFVPAAEKGVEPVGRVFELDLGERDAGRFHGFDRGVERARMPGDRDRHVAQIGKGANARILPHHDRAGTHCGVEPDDLALAQPLHALDRAPFTYGVDFERAVLKLGLLPTTSKILHTALGAFGIVLVIDDVEALFGEEALLDRDPPGTVVGIAVALKTDGAGHGDTCRLDPTKAETTLCPEFHAATTEQVMGDGAHSAFVVAHGPSATKLPDGRMPRAGPCALLTSVRNRSRPTGCRRRFPTHDRWAPRSTSW